MRRKAGPYEKELRAASEELGLPKDNWQTERLATCVLMFKVARAKWSQGMAATDANQMLALMSEITAIRKEAKLQEPMEITIQVVPSVRENGLEDTSAAGGPAPAIETASSGHADAIAGRSSDQPLPSQISDGSNRTLTPNMAPADSNSAPAHNLPPPKDGPTVEHRQGVSASPFHNAVINGREVAPLKKHQPDIYAIRRTSPMSER